MTLVTRRNSRLVSRLQTRVVGRGVATAKTIFGSALAAWYDPAQEYAPSGGNISALGNAATANTAYDLSQGTPGSQPPYNETDATANNKPTIGNFDGIDDVLTAAASPYSNVAAFRDFWVFKFASTTTSQLPVQGTNNTPAIQVTGNVIYTYAAAAVYGYCAFTNTNWCVIERKFDGSQTGNDNRYKLYINGTLQTLTWTGTVPATMGANSLLRLGSYSSSLFFFSGKFAEAVVSTDIDDSMAFAYRRLLGAKFGIPVS